MTPNPKPTDAGQAWATLVDFAVANLPDSLEERRKVLNALVVLVPSRVPSAKRVAELLDHLSHHILLQREFPFGGNDED